MERLRKICVALPGAHEEPAWVGTRWKAGGKTFVHVLPVVGGRPAAYARACGSDDAVVLTFRSAVPLKPPYFRAVWGTKWGPQVYGLELGGRVDWKKLAKLLAESHRLMATPRGATRSRSARSRR